MSRAVSESTILSIVDLLAQPNAAEFSERQIAAAHDVSRSVVRRAKRLLAAHCSREAVEQEYGPISVLAKDTDHHG